jgi:hypothetical protein
VKGKDHMEDTDIERRIILEWILKKQGGRLWTEFIWPRKGSSGRFL